MKSHLGGPFGAFAYNRVLGGNLIVFIDESHVGIIVSNNVVLHHNSPFFVRLVCCDELRTMHGREKKHILLVSVTKTQQISLSDEGSLTLFHRS